MQIAHFELHEVVGKGGMGEVWSGRHVATGAPVAVKLLSERWAGQPEFKVAFREEVRAVASLEHPNIVRVLDYGEVTELEAKSTPFVAGCPFLCMELVDGGTLEEQVGILSWVELKRVLLGVLEALAHSHARGVTHRDIKGGNILLGRRGPVLTDYGIAHVAARGREARRQVGDVTSGTRSYMAPEQFRGDWRRFGPGTDLYALGALFWRMITGHRPFRTRTWFDAARAHASDPLPEFVPTVAVPYGLEHWLRTCLAKDPTERFLFAADAIHALDQLEDLSRVPAPMPTRWRARRKNVTDSALTDAGLGLFGVRPVPLVAREDARDALWDALAAVYSGGRQQVVVVRGATGTGTSKVTEWFCQRAHEVGAAQILAAVHGKSVSPVDGIGPMIARHFRITDEVGVRRSRLVEREARALGATTSWEWKLLDALLDSSQRDPSPTDRNAVLRNLFRRIGETRPSVVWLDDAQWGLESLSVCCDVLAVPTCIPVLFVLAVRDDALVGRAAEAALIEELAAEGVVVTLDRLDRSATEGLIGQLLDLRPALTNRVAEIASGDPLFAVQLLEDLVQQGVLEPGRLGYEVPKGVEPDLPTSLSELWTQRIERQLVSQPASAREALEIAALLGHEVRTEEWLRALDAAGVPDAMGLVQGLVERRLARAHPEGSHVAWSFVHGSLREALIRGIPDPAPHHRACAVAIHSRGSGNLARRGRHLHHGGQHALAVDVLGKGIQDSISRSRWADVPPLVRLREVSLRGVGADETDSRFGDGWAQDIEAAVFRGQHDEAERGAQRLLEHSVAHGWTDQEAQAALLLGAARVMRLEHPDAVAYFHRALRLMEGRQQFELQARAFRGLALCALSSADTHAAIESADAAYAAFQSAGDTVGLGSILHIRAAALIQERRWGSAGRDLDAAEPLCSGAPLKTAALLSTRGYVALRRGELDLALEKYTAALEISIKIQSNIELPIRLGMASVGLRRGEVEGALAATRKVRSRVAGLGSPARTARADAFLAAALAANGAWVEFDSCLERIAAVERMPTSDTAENVNDAGDLAAKLGETPRARRAWNLAIGLWTELGSASLVEQAQMKLDALA